MPTVAIYRPGISQLMDAGSGTILNVIWIIDTVIIVYEHGTSWWHDFVLHGTTWWNDFVNMERVGGTSEWNEFVTFELCDYTL
jgi:hypothetical protein